MPFDKQYPHPSLRESDALGSPDLELLAGQLRGDASQLAARYPARVPEAGLLLERKPQGTRWTSVTAAALLAVASWGTLIASRLPEPEFPRAAVVRDDLASPLVKQLPLPPPESDTSPASFYFDLSGPEQEAVLDLLEGHKLASLSI
jgi:hypothetical protein